MVCGCTVMVKVRKYSVSVLLLCCDVFGPPDELDLGLRLWLVG